MKIISLILCGVIALGFPYVSLANTERPDQKETPNTDIRPMAFDQCIEILHNYQDEMGPPRVILDAPALRIVQFTTHDEKEQIACDGDDNVMTVMDIDDD